MDDDPKQAWALARYQAISAYLALDPPRGRKRATLEQLAGKTWTGPRGEPFSVSAETLRVWVRRYKKCGLPGLRDATRPQRGSQAVTLEQAELVRRLKREVPERSLERIIAIAEQTGQVPQGVLRRSTVHRILQKDGISARQARPVEGKDLDRWEASFPNDLWQSDLLAGPWLPDPVRPGKMKRAWLFCFLDDHSRLLLHGRFDWRQGQPALELVMKRALQKYGIPRRCYFDNGKVYRSRHTARICGGLGVHRVVYTRVRRPEGHGKIEAFNRLVRSAFLPEVEASRGIVTLDQLNEAFVAWVEAEYNARVHGQTGQAPLSRWRQAAATVRYPGEEALRQAFLFSEERTPDKAGVFTVAGVAFQVGPRLCRRRVQVRFDPEALWEVEVWQAGQLVERARPLVVHSDRRPFQQGPKKDKAKEASPPTDWLAHLVQKRRDDGLPEPDPRAFADAARKRREDADEAVLAVLRQRLDAAAVDEDAARDWLLRFGPLDPDGTAAVLDSRLALGEPKDHHVTRYLQAARAALHGD